MQIFPCEVHRYTRAAALVFAIYLMWYSRANMTHPIFVGGGMAHATREAEMHRLQRHGGGADAEGLRWLSEA